MPHVIVNIGAQGAEFDRAALRAHLQALAPEDPVVILIHGYSFEPGRPGHCPHEHILAMRPDRGCWKATSWPRHMGFGRGRDGEGLVIALGWHARCSIWSAYARAAHVGRILAALVEEIATFGHRVDLLAHSLGARVALQCVAHAQAGTIGRVILLAAAEFRRPALAVLDTPAGRGAEVINVTSAENALFDRLLESVVWPFSETGPWRGWALGVGTHVPVRNWLDLRVDDHTSRTALAALGYAIPAPKRRVCHWGLYLRPGLFKLYRDLVRRREALPLHVLRAQTAKPSVDTTPNWVSPRPFARRSSP